MHASQLSNCSESSAGLLFPASLPSWLSSAESLRPLLAAQSQAALDAFDAAHPHHAQDDLRVTYFVTWGQDMRSRVQSALEGGGGGDTAPPLVSAAGGAVSQASTAPPLGAEESQHCALITHVCALPARPQPPVHLLVRGAPRHNAGAKSSDWVKQRAGLEALLKAGDTALEEIILHTPEGGLLEGLSTNVAAVCGGGVVTPHEGVLHGTVREVLLEMAAAARIPVHLEAPSLSALAACTGVSVSSTSRLSLPGSSVELPVALLGAASKGGEPQHDKLAMAQRSTAAWLQCVQASAAAQGVAAAAVAGSAVELAPPTPLAELKEVFETTEPYVMHMPHPSGDGGAFVFAGPPPDSDKQPVTVAGLRELTAAEADTLPRMRYRLLEPADAGSHAVLDFFTTQVPPEFRGAGMAGKLARGALDTTALLGARAKPSCSYLHATFVPRNLGYMDVVSEITPEMQAAAEAALAAVTSSPDTDSQAAAAEGAGGGTSVQLGALHPSKVRMRCSDEHEGHVHVAFSLSPVSQLLDAMVQAQVASHSTKVR